MAIKKPEKKPKRNPAEHLKDHRIKPGQVLNPKGRPKKAVCIPDILNAIGDEKITVNGKEITKREAVCMRVYSDAVKGQSWAIHFIADRTEGKAIERVINEATYENELIKRLSSELSTKELKKLAYND